jgi:hypothetical protein
VKPIVRWLFIALAALLVLFLAFGFYRVYYGKHVYETVAPELPANLNKPAILIFSKQTVSAKTTPLKLRTALCQRSPNGAAGHPS